MSFFSCVFHFFFTPICFMDLSSMKTDLKVWRMGIWNDMNGFEPTNMWVWWKFDHWKIKYKPTGFQIITCGWGWLRSTPLVHVYVYVYWMSVMNRMNTTNNMLSVGEQNWGCELLETRSGGQSSNLSGTFETRKTNRATFRHVDFAWLKTPGEFSSTSGICQNPKHPKNTWVSYGCHP